VTSTVYPSWTTAQGRCGSTTVSRVRGATLPSSSVSSRLVIKTGRTGHPRKTCIRSERTASRQGRTPRNSPTTDGVGARDMTAVMCGGSGSRATSAARETLPTVGGWNRTHLETMATLLLVARCGGVRGRGRRSSTGHVGNRRPATSTSVSRPDHHRERPLTPGVDRSSPPVGADELQLGPRCNLRGRGGCVI
jgi:hypothetical protein